MRRKIGGRWKGNEEEDGGERGKGKGRQPIDFSPGEKGGREKLAAE